MDEHISLSFTSGMSTLEGSVIEHIIPHQANPWKFAELISQNPAKFYNFVSRLFFNYHAGTGTNLLVPITYKPKLLIHVSINS